MSKTIQPTPMKEYFWYFVLIYLAGIASGFIIDRTLLPKWSGD